MSLTKKQAEDRLSEWILKPADGGHALISAGSKGSGDQDNAIQFFDGRFTTYPYRKLGCYAFNFYRESDR